MSLIHGFRFGPFELDARAGELRRHGLKVRLRGRPVEILICLLERAGQVVTREDLRTRLWTGDTFVDFDHGLNSAMNKLREALGDAAENPRYVETVPRRGYRFIAPVEPVTHPAPPPPPAAVPSEPVPAVASEAPITPAPRARAVGGVGRWLAVAGLVLLGVIAGAWLLRDRLWGGASGKAMLIVLPFQNRSGNADDEFFSDGVTDEMIAQLGALDPRRLGVIARTTAMRYKASHKDVMQIGQELGVDYLLEGSVRRDATRVRITAQLVDVRSQTQLWAETYERDVRDVLMLQRDVAERIAQSLAGSVLSPVLARATHRSPSFAAYERALKGRAYRQQATEGALRQCIVMFEEAIALDAEYAGAYAGLADCYRLLGGPGWEVGPPSELLGQARVAAERALELDPELPEAYAARGMVRFSFDWDLAGADRDLSRAIALNPSYARAHQYRSAVLTTMGRFDEAVASARRAWELDPLSATESTTLGVRLYYAGKYRQAIQQFEQTLAAHPDFPPAHWGLGQTFRQMGRHADAIRELEVAAGRANQSPYMRAWLAHALAAAGRRDDAELIRRDLASQASQRFVAPFLFALMASGVGEKEATLDWLEKVRSSKSGWIPFVPVEPEFAWLRDDPRFRQLTADVRR